jgi:hypothetical protein
MRGIVNPQQVTELLRKQQQHNNNNNKKEKSISPKFDPRPYISSKQEQKSNGKEQQK